MAEKDGTQAEPQQPAQSHAPQPVLEKAPLQGQQAMQFFPFAPGQPQQPLVQPASGDYDKLPFSRPWHIAKIVLGSASILCSIVIWAVGIVMLARYTTGTDAYDDNYYDYDDAAEVGFEAGFAIAWAGVAIIWQAAEFITVWASKTSRGIHPGANVALHLIIWLVGAIVVGFLATFVAFDIDDLDDADVNAGYYDTDGDTPSYGSLAVFQTRIRLEEALLAFSGVLMLLHFVLFVRACVETQQYNSRRRHRTRTVYVPVPVQVAGLAPDSQQPVGYFAYQPMPSQSLPFVLPPQQHQQQPQLSGAPAPPQQAHLYGYYAPAPAPVLQSRPQEDSPAPAVAGPSTAAAVGYGPSGGDVSPVSNGGGR